MRNTNDPNSTTTETSTYAPTVVQWLLLVSSYLFVIQVVQSLLLLYLKENSSAIISSKL